MEALKGLKVEHAATASSNGDRREEFTQAAGSETGKVRERIGEGKMDDLPSSSFTVSSPRRTLSLPKRGEGRAKKTTTGEYGPNPSEVYGFVGAISTVIFTAVFLMWAYAPEPWLHTLGITYYPSKYWALAIPAYATVTVILAMGLYLGLNFIITPSSTSFTTLFDEYSRERLMVTAPDNGVEQPIEPISDIGINEVNDLMFRRYPNC